VKLTVRKLVMGLSYGEDRMIVAGVVLPRYRTVTEGQTDGFTKTSIALCIEYGRAVKTIKADIPPPRSAAQSL